jgi:hypothetical protein
MVDPIEGLILKGNSDMLIYLFVQKRSDGCKRIYTELIFNAWGAATKYDTKHAYPNGYNIKSLFIRPNQFIILDWPCMSTKYQQEKTLSSQQKAFKGRFCPTCKNIGYIFGPDEIDHTEKMFIEECPECNS